MIFFQIVAVFSVVVLFSSCNESLKKSGQVRAIQKRGVFRVGISTDMKKFSYIEPGASEPEGLEIDLARLIAKDILGDEKAARFVPVSPRIMFVLLDNGEIDSLIAGITITEERKKNFRFTSPYYVEEMGVLVRKDSGINAIKALDGKKMGVVTGTTARASFEEEELKIGITMEYVEFESHGEVKLALLEGKIDALVNDHSLLGGLVDNDTLILDTRFAPQPYGIVVNLSNNKLAAYLESFVTKIRADGTLSKLLARWGL
jgi:putative glutamine transport system substrate-binding protein